MHVSRWMPSRVDPGATVAVDRGSHARQHATSGAWGRMNRIPTHTRSPPPSVCARAVRLVRCRLRQFPSALPLSTSHAMGQMDHPVRGRGAGPGHHRGWHLHLASLLWPRPASAAGVALHMVRVAGGLRVATPRVGRFHVPWAGTRVHRHAAAGMHQKGQQRHRRQPTRQRPSRLLLAARALQDMQRRQAAGRAPLQHM